MIATTGLLTTQVDCLDLSVDSHLALFFI